MEQYQQGLDRMDEAFESIAEFKKQVADLMPKKRKAIELVNDHVVNVESQRQQYIEVIRGGGGLVLGGGGGW